MNQKIDDPLVCWLWISDYTLDVQAVDGIFLSFSCTFPASKRDPRYAFGFFSKDI